LTALQFSKKLLKQKVEEMLEKDSNVGMTKWFQDLNKGDNYNNYVLIHFAKPIQYNYKTK